MALQEAEKSDRVMDIRAGKIRIDGKTYSPDEVSGYKVYSDARDPKRRDVFPPGEAKRHGQRLPKTAKVYYDGRWRTAERSFRTRRGGGRVPVYEFYVSSKATE